MPWMGDSVVQSWLPIWFFLITSHGHSSVEIQSPRVALVAHLELAAQVVGEHTRMHSSTCTSIGTPVCMRSSKCMRASVSACCLHKWNCAQKQVCLLLVQPTTTPSSPAAATTDTTSLQCEKVWGPLYCATRGRGDFLKFKFELWFCYRCIRFTSYIL